MDKSQHGQGGRVWIQFPVPDIALQPAMQVNSAWPSLRG